MKNIVKAAKKIVKYQEGGVAGGDYAWLKDILDYESKAGSASGTGLKNYGIKRDKWGKKYDYLDKDEITEEDAIRFMKEEYLPQVKDYPEDVQKRLVDYMYNTGRNIEDVLMHAAGLVDLESVQTKNTDYELFNKNKDAILKSMSDPEFVKKIDNSKHEILKDYWTRKGTPDVYEKTSKDRIDMWNKEEPNSSFNPDPTATSSNVDVKVPGVKTAEQSKQEIQNAIDKEKAMSSNSWSDADISSLLSRGITAQDYKKETLTDYAVGKVPAVPTETTKPASVNTLSKAPEQTKPVVAGSKPITEPATTGSKKPTKLASTGKVSIPKENMAAINAVKRMKQQMAALDEGNKKIVQSGSPDVDKMSEDQSIGYNHVMKNNQNLSDDKINEYIKFYNTSSKETEKGYVKAYKEILRRKKFKGVGSFKKGGYIHKMQVGGIAGDPPKGRRYRNVDKNKKQVFIEGEDGNLYFSGDDGNTYKVADNRIKDTFYDQLNSQKSSMGIPLWYVDSMSDQQTGNPRNKIPEISALPKRPLTVKSLNPTTNIGMNISFRNDSNPKLTTDPTQYGPEIDFNKKGSTSPGSASNNVSSSDENGLNPGLTTDPTQYGPEIGVKSPGSASNNVSSIGANDSNSKLTTDPTQYGPEITPGYGGMFDSYNNPFGDAINNELNNDNSLESGNTTDDINKKFNDLIEERKKDVDKTADEQLAEYRDLQRRTNSRDLASLITSAGGRLLQNREQIPFLKQKRFLDQKYPTYSAQRINQESEAASGAGMEMVKFMNRESGSLSSRLAPILFSRLMEQQGKARRQYNDFNLSQEAKKYNELGNIIDYNQEQIVAAKNQKIDNTNKTIAGVSSDVNAFLASMNTSDNKMVDAKNRINSKRREDIYKLDNQKLELEIYGLDYVQQKQEIDRRIEDYRKQLESENIDEVHKKTLEENMEKLKRLKDKIEIKSMIQ